MRKTFAQTLTKLAAKDDRVVVIVADISHGVFKDFAKKYPKRYFNIGICEPSIVNMAAGLSKVGLIPFVHTIAPFLIERSYEQIKLDFGYQNLPINLVSVGSTFDYSKLGCSHHCYSDVAIMKQLKRAKIFIPGTSSELSQKLMSNYDQNNINYYRISEQQNKKSINCTNPKKIKNGNDMTIVVLGTKLNLALETQSELKKKNINAELIYVNELSKDISTKLIKKSLEKTKKLLCIEEISNRGGLLEECLKISNKISLKYEHIAVDDFIHQYGDYNELSSFAGFNTENSLKLSFKLMGKIR